jgi:8-oxo-dGTP diphosphatase
MPNNSSWCIIQNPVGQILILRRSKHVNNSGLYNLPGGRIDPGESPETSILREVKEEAGLKIKEVSFKRVLLKNDRHLWYYSYKFDKDPKVKIDFESDAFKWLNPEEIKEMGNKLHKPTLYYFNG